MWPRFDKQLSLMLSSVMFYILFYGIPLLLSRRNGRCQSLKIDNFDVLKFSSLENRYRYYCILMCKNILI